MKKSLKIFIIIMVCVILVVGFTVYSNWNTILGVIDGLRYSQEDVEKRQEENKKELQKFLDENENVTVRDLTENEMEALAKGEINQEDAVQIITGQKTLEDIKDDKLKNEESAVPENEIHKNSEKKPNDKNDEQSSSANNIPPENKPEVSITQTEKQPATGGQTTSGNTAETNPDKKPVSGNQTTVGKQPSANNQTSTEKQPSTNNQTSLITQPNIETPKDAPPVSTDGKTSDQIVSELIATLYVQKSVYLSTLDGLEAELGAEFEKLPLEEKRKQKPKIIAKYMPIIAEWEKNCDSAVYGILNQIEAELKKSGKDLSIVDKIEEAYQNEKRLKKAYYINNYMS